MATLALRPAVRTDVGPVRPHNEDAVLATPRLVAVADGVGGAAAGEVASAVVINALAHLEKCRLEGELRPALEAAVRTGNDTMRFVASCRPASAGMSTTLTAVAIDDAGRYVIANIGDSRAYLLRDGALRRLTRDDSYVQELVDAGQVAPEDARTHPQRNIVLAALDGDPARRPAMLGEPARAGDRLLVCSDGLSDMLEDAVLERGLRDVAGRERCADRLLALALDAGARDNVSAIVADVVADPRFGWA